MLMTGEEKFNTCEHRSTFPKKVFVGCPCKKQTRDIYSCQKKNLAEVKPEICQDCTEYSPKNP